MSLGILNSNCYSDLTPSIMALTGDDYRGIELIRKPDADLASLSKKASAIRALGTVAFTNINKVCGAHISGAAYQKIAYTDVVGKVLREEIAIKNQILFCVVVLVDR